MWWAPVVIAIPPAIKVDQNFTFWGMKKSYSDLLNKSHSFSDVMWVLTFLIITYDVLACKYSGIARGGPSRAQTRLKVDEALLENDSLGR